MTAETDTAKDVELYQTIARQLSWGKVRSKLDRFKVPIEDAKNSIWVSLQKHVRDGDIQDFDAYVCHWLAKLADRLIDREKKHRRHRVVRELKSFQQGRSPHREWSVDVSAHSNYADPAWRASAREVSERISELPCDDRDSLEAVVVGRRNDPHYPTPPKLSEISGRTAEQIRFRGAAVLRKLINESD